MIVASDVWQLILPGGLRAAASARHHGAALLTIRLVRRDPPDDLEDLSARVDGGELVRHARGAQAIVLSVEHGSTGLICPAAGVEAMTTLMRCSHSIRHEWAAIATCSVEQSSRVAQAGDAPG
jgi:hypothetical protein